MKIKMPAQAAKVIQTLEQHGFEAYIVGGCVRDSILGRTPGDWDITTSASPQEVKEIFDHTVDTGIEHGTVTVLMNHEPYEVTTYRVDGKYEDHRRPNEVHFTKSLREDLLRRDFTINAMAYNDSEGIIDMYDGMTDLKNQTIRCVGEAKKRFDEDALRILRALRFQAQLGFQIEEKTEEAIKNQAKFLKDISAERIQVELEKLITSAHPEVLVNAYKLGVTKIIFPEFDIMMETPQNNPHHKYNVGIHTVEAMKQIEAEHIYRWTMLLHDVGKPTARVEGPDKDHFKMHPVIGEEMFTRLMEVQKADISAQSDYQRDKKEQVLQETKKLFEEIIEEKNCLSIKELKINGKDLMDMGVPQGKEIGQILSWLLDQVLEDPQLNECETLTRMAEEKRDAK